MLLPSPLPCEPFLPASKLIRPTLRTLGAYQSSDSQCASAANTLIASCRALQSIIGNTPLSCQNGKQTQSQSRAPSLAVRRRTTETQATRDPLLPYAHNAKVRKASPVKPKSVSRGYRKRRRDENEADAGSDDGKAQVQSPSFDQENSNTFSTPKRQRRIPLSMPLGLTAADFQSLDTPRRDVELNMPDPPPLDNTTETDSHSQADSEWTPADDSALVSTVLEKLQLSKREWNDCARILGKDQDSIGKRWKLLIGEGDVGLRRGKRIGRTGLDIKSW